MIIQQPPQQLPPVTVKTLLKLRVRKPAGIRPVQEADQRLKLLSAGRKAGQTLSACNILTTPSGRQDFATRGVRFTNTGVEIGGHAGHLRGRHQTEQRRLRHPSYGSSTVRGQATPGPLTASKPRPEHTQAAQSRQTATKPARADPDIRPGPQPKIPVTTRDSPSAQADTRVPSEEPHPAATRHLQRAAGSCAKRPQGRRGPCRREAAAPPAGAPGNE